MAAEKKPTLHELFGKWKLQRWPGMPPREPDWSDVETAFKAGFFLGLYEGAAADGVPAAPAPADDEATTDQLLELAGALEQRRGLAIVEAVTALAAGYHEGPFRAGFETACEEITLRLRTEVWDGCLPPVDAPKDGLKPCAEPCNPSCAEDFNGCHRNAGVTPCDGGQP